eukprot:Gb_08984 [translate_table: standard]
MHALVKRNKHRSNQVQEMIGVMKGHRTPCLKTEVGSGNMPPKKRMNAYKLWKALKFQKDPILALQMFNSAEIRHNSFTYDVIIHKLGRAKMFREMESVLEQLRKESGFKCREGLLGNVIKLYGQARMADSAIQTFQRMPLFGCTTPSLRSFNTLLNAMLPAKRYEMIECLYESMPRSLSPDACTYNILIKAACIGNRLDYAWDLFEEMRNSRGSLMPTVVTYGTLISAFCTHYKINQAFQLLGDMSRNGVSLHPNLFIYTSLIGGLCNEEKVDEALELKEKMVTQGMIADAVTYTTLINGLCKVGRSKEVDKLLEEMCAKGCKPQTVTYNTIITSLCKQGKFQVAHNLLEEMMGSYCKPDVVTYNILITGLCREGKVEEATDLFEDMPRRGCPPDVVTFRTLLDGLCGVGRFCEAAMILDEMIFNGFAPHSSSASKLIHGLCEEGKMELAFKALQKMAKNCHIELSTWETLIPEVCSEIELQKASELLNHILKIS